MAITAHDPRRTSENAHVLSAALTRPLPDASTHRWHVEAVEGEVAADHAGPSPGERRTLRAYFNAR